MQLKEMFDKISGSYDGVMERLLSEERVIKFLGKFVNSPEYDNIVKAYDEKNYEDLFLHSHSLKGVALNLGLSKLGKSASELCDSVRHGPPEGIFPAFMKK